MPADLAVIVTARNEAERIGATLRALRTALRTAELWVADDASDDATAAIARDAGARVVTAPKRVGKGGAATLAAKRVDAAVVVLADADLGESALELGKLVAALATGAGGATSGGADVAIGSFARRVGGGFGIALRASRWATERAGGLQLEAPMSGQRAIRGARLPSLLPFAHGFGMETGMNIDAARAGLRIVEVQLDLEHRATGRTPGGFVHRVRQLLDLVRAYASRRR